MRVDGQLPFSSIADESASALSGLGMAVVPEEMVRADLEIGRLVRVLADWCAPFSGYHLYYPSRRQRTPAFGLIVEALWYRGSPMRGGGRMASRTESRSVD